MSAHSGGAARHGGAAFIVALTIFFLSGFAALAYQVIWQRLLVIFSGADIYSVTIIVAAYMGGLGLGSLVGGRWADRLGHRRSLWAFAAVELLIGAFGLVSKPLYYDGLYERVPHLAATPSLAALVLFLSLLWPTFLMGVSLPLLARALTSTLERVGRVVGSLYGWNTLGAAAGAFVSTWILLPRFGLEQSLWIAAATNLACAVAAALLAWDARVHRDWQESAEGPAADPVTADEDPFPYAGWVLIYALTGFIALGLEIAWFRVLSVMLKSTAFTFGTLLAIYVAGLGCGAVVGAHRVGRTRRPGATFLLLQLGVVLYTGASTIAMLAVLATGHPVKLVRYLGQYEPVDVYRTVAALGHTPITGTDGLTPFFDFLILYLVIPAVLIGPPTFLMGMSFPYLQQASHRDLDRLGRRVGTLLGSNIGGSMAGAIVAGWLLLPLLGTAGTLKLLVGTGALLIVPLAYLRGRRNIVAAARVVVPSAAVTGAIVLLMPNGGTLWARLHGTSPGQMIFAEDGAGLSVLKYGDAGFAGRTIVYVNGLGQSWIPYDAVHTALGALPVLIHPAPADVLMIGLGSGASAFAAACRAEVQRLTSVEIIGAQLQTLRRLARVQPYPGLRSLLSDARVTHEVGDGRAYILQSGRSFDVIEADALRPTSAYSGNLYSKEYFTLVARHLKPGGMAVTWAPTARIQRTFLSVFSHVLALGDIYVGSNTEIPFDRGALEARISAAEACFERAGIDIAAVLRPYLGSAIRYIGPSEPRVFTDLNTDTFPRDEFALPF